MNRGEALELTSRVGLGHVWGGQEILWQALSDRRSLTPERMEL
jgi:hypothetical protein